MHMYIEMYAFEQTADVRYFGSRLEFICRLNC